MFYLQVFAYLSIAHCQFFQEVAKNQGWIFNQTVPEDLLGNSTYWKSTDFTICMMQAQYILLFPESEWPTISIKKHWCKMFIFTCIFIEYLDQMLQR